MMDLMNTELLKCVVCRKMEVIGGRKRAFYPFPRDLIRCREWIRVIGMESLLYMPLEELYQQHVCEDHFPPDLLSVESVNANNLPTITQYPSLADNIVSLWPYCANRVDHPPTFALPSSTVAKEAERNYFPDDDYDSELQACLEQQLTSNSLEPQLAGISYPISAPQMTYSTSFNEDTIFAAPEARISSVLPSPVGPDNIKKKSSQHMISVETLIQQQSNDYVIKNVNVFNALASTTGANKIVQTASKSNTTPVKSHKYKQSSKQCSTLHHQLLINSQYEKSRMRTYKRNRLNTANNETFMGIKGTTKPKEHDPIKDKEPESNTCVDTRLEQNTQTSDSTNVIPKPPNTQVSIINRSTECSEREKENNITHYKIMCFNSMDLMEISNEVVDLTKDGED